MQTAAIPKKPGFFEKWNPFKDGESILGKNDLSKEGMLKERRRLWEAMTKSVTDYETLSSQYFDICKKIRENHENYPAMIQGMPTNEMPKVMGPPATFAVASYAPRPTQPGYGANAPIAAPSYTASTGPYVPTAAPYVPTAAQYAPNAAASYAATTAPTAPTAFGPRPLNPTAAAWAPQTNGVGGRKTKKPRRRHAYSRRNSRT
jgi:hypothetical protein